MRTNLNRLRRQLKCDIVSSHRYGVQSKRSERHVSEERPTPDTNIHRAETAGMLLKELLGQRVYLLARERGGWRGDQLERSLQERIKSGAGQKMARPALCVPSFPGRKGWLPAHQPIVKKGK